MSNNPLPTQLPVSYEEWECMACKILNIKTFDSVVGGAGTEETIRANREAFYQWRILPRFLVDVSERNLSVSMFGHTFPTPILLAPIGREVLFHPDAELASARAASALGVPFILSTQSSRSIEEVATAMGNSPRWFQLYWGTDFDVTTSMLRRAEASGYSAIVLTVDRPLEGWRNRDIRNQYLSVAFPCGIANFLTDPVFLAKLGKSPQEDMGNAINQAYGISFNPRLTWKQLALLRNYTKLPILIKGILDSRDAELALKHGVDGIIVSNHGGRQLDGAEAALDALPKVCEVLRGRIPVLMDSGIHCGADVVKALAFGASAILIGRLYIFGLTVAGELGVTTVLRNLISETDLTIALSGIRSVSEIDRSVLVRA